MPVCSWLCLRSSWVWRPGLVTWVWPSHWVCTVDCCYGCSTCGANRWALRTHTHTHTHTHANAHTSRLTPHHRWQHADMVSGPSAAAISAVRALCCCCCHVSSCVSQIGLVGRLLSVTGHALIENSGLVWVALLMPVVWGVLLMPTGVG